MSASVRDSRPAAYSLPLNVSGLPSALRAV